MDNITYNVLNNYFSRLENVGYYSYNNLNNVLILIYIYYFMENYELTAEESNIVRKALSCIQDNCLFSYN